MIERDGLYHVRPIYVEVGKGRNEMFECFDKYGAIIGDGVGRFFGSRDFIVPFDQQTIGLFYLTPRSLGFQQPVNLMEIKKKIKKKNMALDECTMDTAMNLTSLMAERGDTGVYYVVSEEQKNKDGGRPDFLRIDMGNRNRFGIYGWRKTDLITIDDFLVFQYIGRD